MKKKVALLLALVMVLATMPMNVFGNPLNVRGNGRLVQGVTHTSEWGGDWREIIVDLDIEQMAEGQVQGVSGNYYSLLRITLVSNPDDNQWDYAALRAGDGGANHVAVLDHTHLMVAGATSGAATMFELGNFLLERGQPNRQGGWENAARPTQILLPVSFDGGQVIEPGTQGILRLGIGLIVARGATATIRIEMQEPGVAGGFRELLPTVNVGGARNPYGVTFTRIGDAMPFAEGMILPPIRIAERVAGVSMRTGSATIRLIAPLDYVWNRGILGPMGATPGAGTLLGFPLEMRNVNHAFNIAAYPNNRFSATVTDQGVVSQTDRRQWIDVTFTVPPRNPNPAAAILRGEMDLHGLALVAMPGASPEGAVSIDIAWAPAWAPWGSYGRTEAGNRFIQSQIGSMFATDWRANWNELGFEIGQRRDVALELNTTTVPTRMSGLAGYGYAGQNLNPTPVLPIHPLARPGITDGNIDAQNADFGGAANVPFAVSLYEARNSWNATSGIRSAQLQITELVPGAFDTGVLNSLVDFTFGEGVQVMHTAIRLVNAGGGGAGWLAIPTMDYVHAWDYVRSVWTTDALWDAGHWGIPYTRSDYVRFFVPRNMNPNVRRTLEVYFLLSIEAGYEWKHGDEVVVTVGGPAVAALGDVSHDVVIMNVQDPIAIELDGPMLQVETGRTHNLMERTPIGDLVINEADVAANDRFRVGDLIWVYVVGTNIQRPHTLAFHTAPNAIIEAGALQLAPAQMLRRTLPNGLTVDGVSFRVVRQSTAGAPSTIRLTNNELFGEILPGQDYMLVVSGPRVAANEWHVSGRAGAAGGWTTTWEVNPDFRQAVETVDLTVADIRLALASNPDQLQIFNNALTQVGWDGTAQLNAGWPRWQAYPGADAAFTASVIAANFTGLTNNTVNRIAIDGTIAHWGGAADVTTTHQVIVPAPLSPTNWPFIMVQTPSVIGINGNTLGIFDTLPYAVQVIEWVGFDYDYAPPAGQRGGDGTRLAFYSGQYVDTAYGPIVGMRLMEIPGTGFHTALFNPRVFADFVGAEINYASGVATFSGVNWHGVETTIVLTAGSTDLVVNGEARDIALVANQPQLANRVAPATVDGRFFVPVRALANLWGVPVEWTGRTVVLG